MTTALLVAEHDLSELAQSVDRLREVIESRQPDPWLDEKAAADYLAVSVGALRALVRRKQIPVTRSPVGRLRWKRSELDAWMRSEPS